MVTQTELYRFSERGSDSVWTFTSGNEVVTYDASFGPEKYIPTAIARTEAQIKNEIAQANIDVQLALTNEAGMRWLADNGEKIVSLTIFERAKNNEINVIWKGRLASLAPGMKDITLKMESIFTSLRRPGLRARYTRSCRHPLYGRGCFVDPEDFAVLGSASAVNVKTFTIAEAAGMPDGYYTGGMLRAPDNSLSYIISHIGTSIAIQRMSFSFISAIEDGFPFDVTLYPGCAHSRPECNDKFDNLLNYGGFDFIPTKNPMGGSSIV